MADRAIVVAALRGLLAVACGLLAACGGGSPAADKVAAVSPPASGAASAPPAGAASPASAPPVSVGTVRAVRRDVAVEVEATGTVSALSSVEIKPQLASIVSAVHVKEGQFVAQGQPLFTLDSRADQANLARAEAQLLRDQALLADAQRQLARGQELLGQNFVTQGAVDTSRAQVDAQRAALAADRAAIDAARVAVSYGRIAAPSAGRVGQIAVFPGSSVAPGGAPMVTITQLDPIAVSFNLPQRHLGDVLAALAARGKGGEGSAGGRVRAVLPEGRGAREGTLQFVDNQVDPASGTVRVKAQFANKDQALWPGAYVNVELALQALPGAVVVPQAAIVQGARGTALFVVGDDDQVTMRPVKVLQPLGLEAAVSGVKAGERIVLDGRQNVRPGTRVVERSPERAPQRPASAAGSRPQP